MTNQKGLRQEVKLNCDVSEEHNVCKMMHRCGVWVMMDRCGVWVMMLLNVVVSDLPYMPAGRVWLL